MQPEPADDEASEHDAADESLEQHDRLAVAASAERGALLAAITTDLGPSLAAARFRAAAIAVLARRFDVAGVIEQAERIEADAAELARIIAQIGPIHLDDPLSGPRRTPIDLHRLVRRVVDTMEIANHRIHVRGSDRPTDIAANEFQVERIVSNLLANSLRFAPRNSVIEIVCAPRGSDVVLAIDDAGPGVPHTDRDLVFVAGYTTSPPHAGLGLYFVRTFAEANQGEVRIVDSQLGGARFEVRMPALA